MNFYKNTKYSHMNYTRNCDLTSYFKTIVTIITLTLSSVFIQAEETTNEVFNWTGVTGSSFNIENGVINQSLNKVGTFDGIVSCTMKGVKKNTEYEFTCLVNAPLKQMAYIQVKLFKDGKDGKRKELKRFTSQRNKSTGEKLRVVFNSLDADKIQILCRIIRKDHFIGKNVTFRDFYFGKPQNINAENEPFKWKVVKGSSFHLENGVISQSLNNEGSTDGIVSCTVNNRQKNTEYEFSCLVNAPLKHMAYIQVKLFKNGEGGKRIELKRITSKHNKANEQKLSVAFNSMEADKIQLICRIVRKKQYLEKAVTFQDFYFGSPRMTKLDSSVIPKVEVVPGFEVCSIYYNHCKAEDYNEIKGNFFFRVKGEEKWLPSINPVYVRHEKSLRGSLLKLRENTEYELKLIVNDSGKKNEVVREFKTKNIVVPIVKTVCLTTADLVNGWQPESGTSDGYIQYVLSPGQVLSLGKKHEAVISLNNAKYIILNGLSVRGGRRFGISINNSEYIQIINCDISGFGRIGKFRPDLEGKFYDNDSKQIWLDAGINIVSSDNILIERNYIHDPDAYGNSWFYSHPAAPEGISVRDSSSVAIRYNDIIGSDLKRWNDGIAGDGNFLPDGGLRRDAEICGNYFAFGNDDGTELDGGQMNAHFFHNLVEGFYCGLSLAACKRGPSYVFQNKFINPGDEYDFSGIGIKMVSSISTIWGPVCLFSNDVFWKPHGIYPPAKMPVAKSPLFLLHARGNKYLLPSPYARITSRTDFKYDIDDTKNMSEYLPPRPKEFPGRPTGISVSQSHINFQQLDNTINSKQITINVTNQKLKSKFNIIQPASSKQFKVLPESGLIEFGKPVTLTVSSCPENINIPRRNTGAFAVKLETGFSRPISVTVDTRKNPTLLKSARSKVIYGTIQKNQDSSMDLIFNIPKEGKFYLFVKNTNIISERGSMASIRLDEGVPQFRSQMTQLYTGNNPWCCLRENPWLKNRPIYLSPGKHVFHVERYKNYRIPDYTECALIKNPELFLFAPDDIVALK